MKHTPCTIRIGGGTTLLILALLGIVPWRAVMLGMVAWMIALGILLAAAIIAEVWRRRQLRKLGSVRKLTRRL